MKEITSLLILLVLIISCNEKKPPAEAAKGEMQMTKDAGKDELHLSDQQIQLGNITVDTAGDHLLGEELLITGTANVNQNLALSIASRVMGRIEKLYLKNTGDIITKGEPLYEIYSEDLNIAVKELLLAEEKNRSLSNEQVDMEKIVESARNKLRLYGLSETQIRELGTTGNTSSTIKILSPASGIITSVDVKEGDYIMEGASIFHLADFSSLWVEGQVYSDYLHFIKNGMTASISFPGFPEKKYSGKISFINPELNSASKINFIRIEIPNEDHQLKPGMQAYVSVLTGQKKVLSLPTDAILIEGKGATIWVRTGHNTFKSRMISTGMEAGGLTEITTGLEKGEMVVVTGVYLLNSEFIFKNGETPMEGHDMKNM